MGWQEGLGALSILTADGLLSAAFSQNRAPGEAWGRVPGVLSGHFSDLGSHVPAGIRSWWNVLCVCMYVYMHVCMHPYSTGMCTYVCMYVCVHMCMHTFVCTHVCTCACVYIRVCLCACSRTYACMHMCVCNVSVYVYMHVHLCACM